MANVKFWELPARALDAEDRMIAGRAGVSSTAPTIGEVFKEAVSNLPDAGAALSSQERLLAARAAGDTVRLTAAQVAAGLPLAEGVSRGLLLGTEREKLQRLSTDAQVPPGGLIGQVLVKTGDNSYELGWTTIEAGGGGGNYTFVNLGTGAPLFVDAAGDIVKLRSLKSDTQALLLTGTSDMVRMSVAEASASQAGLLSTTDKQKLNAIPSGWAPPGVFAGTTAGLVPAPPTQPGSGTIFLAGDGQWRTPAGGGSINLGEPPSSPASDVQAYGRAFVNGIGGWYPVSMPGHDHHLLDLNGVSLDGAPTPATVHWDGNQLAWRQPYATTELADVQPTPPADGSLLVWSEASQKYVPTPQTAAASSIAKRSTIVGPATVTLEADMMGKLTPVDLSAGDVTIEIDDGLTHPANTVIYGQFRVGPSVLSGAKLRFRAVVEAVEPPTVAAQLLGGKGSNNAATPISTWAPEGADKYILNIPAGDDAALLIAVATHVATFDTPATLTVTLDGQSITLNEISGVNYGTSTAWRYYTVALGDLSSPSTKTFRVTGGSNCSCYCVQMVALHNVAQTDGFIDIQHYYTSAGLASVTYTGTASQADALRIYCADRVQASGSNAPTTSGATQVAWTNVGTASNRGASTHVLATETVLAPGTMDCTITWASAQNSAALMLSAKGLSGGPPMAIRTTGNVLPDVSAANDFVTVIYDKHANEALVVF